MTVNKESNVPASGGQCPRCAQLPLQSVWLDFNTNSTNDDVQRDVLLHNLRHFGWSPLCIAVPSLLNNGNTNETAAAVVLPLLQSASQWRSQLMELFRERMTTTTASSNPSDTAQQHHGAVAIYRNAESGAAHATTVEPKESWEVPRRWAAKTTTAASTYNDTSRAAAVASAVTAHAILHRYCRLMHTIVRKVVQQLLAMPPHTVLAHDDDDDNNNANLDLLRCFYYHAVTLSTPRDQDSDPDEPVLGSSPHTDWGSWTLVWQDHVAADCLQTRCSQCGKWQAPTTTTATVNNAEYEDYVPFILHLGDVTSLALRQRPLPSLQQPQQQQDIQHGGDYWPSPLHRVVSPQHDGRMSLVYFCYPPPTQSLTGMTHGLQSWLASSLSHPVQLDNTDAIDTMTKASATATMKMTDPPAQMRYADYYLLRNQARQQPHRDPHHDDDDYLEKNAKHQYHAWKDEPLGTVFAAKWAQVQR